MSYSDIDVETYETSLGTRPSDISMDEVSYTLIWVLYYIKTLISL